MEEKRRSQRMPIRLELFVSSLFRQDNERVDLNGITIQVVNISKGGLGFECDKVLPLGFYFNAKLMIGDAEDVLYSVVKIIRCITDEEGKNSYGCEFVGLAPVLEYVFDDYYKKLQDQAER